MVEGTAGGGYSACQGMAQHPGHMEMRLNTKTQSTTMMSSIKTPVVFGRRGEEFQEKI
jgi:hypothetical protein